MPGQLRTVSWWALNNFRTTFLDSLVPFLMTFPITN